MSDDRSPGCPGDLDATAAAIWRKVKALIVTRGDWAANADAYALILGNLARAEQRARKARDDFKGSLTSAGSQGNTVAHPSIKTARDAEHDVMECLRDLRLTPRELAKGAQEAPKPTGPSKFGLG